MNNEWRILLNRCQSIRPFGEFDFFTRHFFNYLLLASGFWLLASGFWLLASGFWRKDTLTVTLRFMIISVFITFSGMRPYRIVHV